MHLNPQQFRPPGDDDARDGLYSQLRENFRKRDLEWLNDPQVRVEAPQRVDPGRIDWDEYPEWRAARQLKAVRKIAKKIDKGKDKPSVMAQAPGSDGLDIIDGHHHALAYVDAKKDPLAYVVHVPSRTGPWTTLHDRQKGDEKKDDFGKTSRADAEE